MSEKVKNNKNNKKIVNFKPKIRSRHGTHTPLRTGLPLFKFRSVIRLGSTTPVVDDVSSGGNRIECNTIQGVKNSSNKLLMKKCFDEFGVVTAPWWIYRNNVFIPNAKGDKGVTTKELPYPVIVKNIYGSRGTGNCKVDTAEAMQKCMAGKDGSQYIIEQYKSYTREYRLHVAEDGCFYTCRKMLKADTPAEKRFQRHDENCSWMVETNPLFDKPINWDAVVADCVKALKSLKLDIAAFDLKIQSAKDKEGKKRANPEWIVIESCSAPSFGNITTQKYLEEIPKVLMRKYKQYMEKGVV